MKKIFIGFMVANISSAFMLYSPAHGQNSLPHIKNLTAVATNCNHQIKITYDLDDPDDEKIKISVQVNAGGQFFPLTAPDAKGDIGYPVTPGKGKQIIYALPEDDTDHQNWSVKIIADDLYNIPVHHLVDQIDSSRLLDDLKKMIGNRNGRSKSGKRHLEKVRKIIEGQFTASGLQVSRQDTLYKKMTGQNIIGRKAGQGEEEKTLIICAHYDTVEDSPGADDNGSGVAGMLEVMRILSMYNFAKSIVFLGCDMEEEGHIGSMAYVSNAGGINPGEYVEGCINFDMIGYYSNRPNSQLLPEGFDVLFPEAYQKAVQDSLRGNFTINIFNTASSALANTFNSSTGKYVADLKLISLEVEDNGQAVPDLRRSDHASFWDGGYQAIYIGDGANTRNANYHSPTDVLETVNITHLANVVKTTVACMAELARVQHSESASCNVQTKDCSE